MINHLVRNTATVFGMYQGRIGNIFTLVLRVATLLCLLLSLSTIPAVAQSAFGSISGTVTDPQGAVIPGATVTVTDESTGTRQSTTTNHSGEFVFPALLPATYTVTAEKEGFKELQKPGAALTSNEQLSVGTLQLSIGSTAATVTVGAVGTPVDTTSSTLGATISAAEIAALPSLGRDYMAFVRVLPGSNYIGEGNVTQGLDSSQATFNGTGGNEIGQGTNSGSYVSTNGVYSSFGENSQDSDATDLDTVRDIHVLLANYDAEYGRSAGSVINITTRSGTSQFHGGVYYYFRNEDLNANDYFNNRNDQPRARYRYNTFGGTLGGPVLLPGFRPLSKKLFFFFNYDSEPSTVPQGLAEYLMPTELERQGNFSQSYIPGTNTLYTVLNPQTGQQYPGNMIPSSQFDPLMQQVIALFPLPNFTNTAISDGNYNYVTSTSNQEPTNRESLRFDYTPASKWQIFGRWQRTFAGNTGKTVPGGMNCGWESGTESYDNTDERFEAGATYTIRPNLVNQATGGYTTNHEVMTAPYSQFEAQNVLAGASFPSPYPDINPTGLLPSFRISRGPLLSFPGRDPFNDHGGGWSLNDGLTDIVGNHQLKFGVYFDESLSLQPNDTGNYGGSGQFNISNPNTSDPYNVGDAEAEALLGYFDSYTIPTNRIELDMVERNLEWYVQDSWRVTKKLTLNYGLRFTLDIPVKIDNQYGSQIDFSQYNAADAPPLFQPVLVNGQHMTENPVTGAIEPAAYLDSFVPNIGNPAPGSVSVGNKSLLNSNGVLVAPRFGFAYDPFGDGKTAIHGGFGEFFIPRSRWGVLYGDITNAPTMFYPTQYYGKVEQVASTTGLVGPSSEQYIDRNGPEPYSLQWSFGIQRELGFKTVMNASYVANVQRHGEYQFNLNEVPYGAEFLPQNQNPTTGKPLPDDYFRPYLGYSSITDVAFADNSSYNSLQVTLTRQFSKRLTFDGAYTWSKLLDDNRTTTYLPLSYQYGPVIGQSRPNRITADWVWNLPNVSRLSNNWLSRGVLNHWAFSGIASFITGPAQMASCSAENGENITGGGDGYECIKTGNAVLPKSSRTFNRYFNTSVFSLPAVLSVGQQWTLANVGNQWNTSFYGPGVNNWDLSFMKNTPIGDKVSAQLRGDMFNAFNHAQFNSINESATFDPATGTQENASFGQLNGDSGPRVVQLSMRIDF